MAELSLFVGMYDIAEESTRYKIRHLLYGYGVRGQYSVFDCWLDQVMRKQLHSQLQSLLQSSSDRIVLARILFPKRIYSLGKQPGLIPADYFYIG